MKRLGVIIIFGLLILSGSFAQTQKGNASYNSSKAGLTISHSSLSFNTRVRITNLSNNRSVEAVVNGRIPVESGRITDVSWETGDALGMSKSGLTPVEIEILPPQQAAAVPPVPPPDAAVSGSGTAVTPAAVVPVSGTPVTPAAAPPVPVAAQPQPEQVPSAAAAEEGQASPVQTITEIQYVQDQYRPCGCPWLIIIIIVLLVVIIVLMIRIIWLMNGPSSQNKKEHPL